MTIQICQGTHSDCEAVLLVLQAAFAGQKGKILPESGVWKETAVSLQTKLQTYTLFLAKDSDRIVGCVFCEPQGEKLYFGRLAVLPDQRGRGIARQLIEQAEQFGRAQRCTSVWLGVRIALEKNVLFFQSLGYQIVSKQAHPGFEHPTFYTMTKPLT
ncbi:MAG: GNAT family N-acetyltransferase [Chloroflexota bacterium]